LLRTIQDLETLLLLLLLKLRELRGEMLGACVEEIGDAITGTRKFVFEFQG